MNSDGQVIIETRLSSEKIESDFKKIDKQTKNMINRYNKSVDSIKKQELALEKVKQKLQDIESGSIVPRSVKNAESELAKVNKELELIDKQANEISNRQETLSFDIESQKSLGELGDSETIKTSELEIQKLDKTMQKLAVQEEQARLKASEFTNKISELKNNSPEVNQLKEQISNMTSSIEESKKQTNELGNSIKKNLSFKTKLMGINGFDEVGKKVDKLKTRMTRLIGTVAIFSLIRNSLTNLRNGFVSLLKQNDSFSSSLNQIKANLMTAFAPIYNACLPAINSLMNSLSKLTGTIAVFVSGLFGTSLEDAKKQAQGLSKSLDNTAKSGEKASGSLASFDNLEVISDNNSSGGGTSSSGNNNNVDYSGEITYSQKLLDTLNKIKDFVVENKDLIIGFLTTIGIAIGVLKLGELLTGLINIGKAFEIIKNFITPIISFIGANAVTIGGLITIIGGLVLVIQGIINYLKDPTWDNFKQILLGIGIVAAGVLLIFGGVPALITLIVGLVVALGLAIYKNWDSIKAILVKVWSWIKEKVVDPVKNGFVSAGNYIKEKWTKIKEFFSNLWNGMLNGAKSTWEGIKRVFSTVASFFKSIFSSAWEGVKKVFSVGGKIFDGIKEGILSGFKTIVNAIIGGINKVVSIPFNGINTALKKIRDVEFLGISPFKKIIKTINVPQIPKLATGAVIPPRSEFMAILGDQKRGVNIETPLETMIDAFNKALDSRGNNSGELVIENLTIINRIGNTDLSKTVVKGVRVAEKQLGKPLFVN